jgi:hypothetical protein
VSVERAVPAAFPVRGGAGGNGPGAGHRERS